MLIRWKSKDKNSNSSSSSKKKRKGREGGNSISLSLYLFFPFFFWHRKDNQNEMDSIRQHRRVCCVLFRLRWNHIDMESLNEWQTNIYLLFILMSTGAVYTPIFTHSSHRHGSGRATESNMPIEFVAPHENDICSELCAWQPQAKRTISDWKTFLRRPYLLNTQWMNGARRKLHCWLSSQCAVTSILSLFETPTKSNCVILVCVQTIRAIDRGRLEFFTSFTTAIISFVCVCVFNR